MIPASSFPTSLPGVLGPPYDVVLISRKVTVVESKRNAAEHTTAVTTTSTPPPSTADNTTTTKTLTPQHCTRKSRGHDGTVESGFPPLVHPWTGTGESFLDKCRPPLCVCRGRLRGIPRVKRGKIPGNYLSLIGRCLTDLRT